ncbi:MAG: Xaa-Pro dipeptidase [Bryobacterales bacterium]|nr:Xaa-Pro dipeptidase [Bryobacterales bacterium]
MLKCDALHAVSVLAGLIIGGPATAKSLAIVDVLVYTSVTAAPLPRASVLMKDGKIVAVGERVRIPRDAEVLRCKGCAVMAGFWNCHIHFTEPKWDDAAKQPAQRLVEQLQSMLGRSGFTTVVDTGSLLANTLALRRRIESGEIPGPRIFTAGVPIYPPDGLPYYVKDTLSPAILHQLIPPRDPQEAASAAAVNLQNGADILKLFTGSWISHTQVLPMPQQIATAAVSVAHKRNRLVFSHPSNLAGMRVAIASGVDILAHAPDDTRGVDDFILREAIANHMAMIPTLKLFSGADNIAEIRRVVRRFHDLGGELMFGTDTGYLSDYDVGEEFQQLGKTGLGTAEILRMLTENPARRFGVQKERGRIAPGMIADITILTADPAVDVTAFSHVRYTIRDGRFIYGSR